ncbi:MAG: WYL domain-containing protein [Dehalococcoidia bacterium]|jgi:predicted DNA-binding transcriptional regulator YafY|nr:WYL domain-containing protein [Dehalococcoidia bacterium]
MPQNPEKEYDRKARLLFLLHLLSNHPRGLALEAIAGHCNVSTRTTRRDLRALEAEYDSKFYEEDGRWVLMPGTVLPPVLFSPPEAMAVFMAARLLLAQSSVYNPDIETTFTKLSTVVPQALRGEIMKTLEWMRRHRPDGGAAKMLRIISLCWTERRQVRIRYWTLNALTAEERVLEPYFVQPSALEHAVYVIGFCHLRREIRVFRLDRIMEAEALETHYEIPAGFDADEYLNAYWSVTATGEPKTVKLRFRREVARIATETVWHHSQVTELQTDGCAVVTMKLALTRDLVSFVLGWSDMVEVLQPATLRQRVAEAARRMLDLYEEPQMPAATGPSYPEPLPVIPRPIAEGQTADPTYGVHRASGFTPAQLTLFEEPAAGER